VAVLSGAEGLELFDLACGLDRAQLVPVKLDLRALRASAREGLLPVLLKGLVPVRAAEGPAGGGGEALARSVLAAARQDRQEVMLEGVRGQIARVLGHESAEAVDPQRTFKDLGFDSLTAVELRNRLGAALGTRLSATLAFDYPTPQQLADHLLKELLPQTGAAVAADPEEAAIRDLLATIPMARLQEAGLIDTLLGLAGPAANGSPGPERAPGELIDTLDVESLVQMTLDRSAAGEER
jgi:acyl carrier protein